MLSVSVCDMEARRWRGEQPCVIAMSHLATVESGSLTGVHLFVSPNSPQVHTPCVSADLTHKTSSLRCYSCTCGHRSCDACWAVWGQLLSLHWTTWAQVIRLCRTTWARVVRLCWTTWQYVGPGNLSCGLEGNGVILLTEVWTHGPGERVAQRPLYRRVFCKQTDDGQGNCLLVVSVEVSTDINIGDTRTI